MPNLKKLSIEYAISSVGKTRSFCGCDKNSGFSQLCVPYDDLKHFGVVVQKNGRSDLIDRLSRADIRNALHSLYFETTESFWYEDLHVDWKTDKDGYLYLIRLQGTDLCKIGITKDYTERIKAFRVEFPIEVEVIAVFKVVGMRSTEDVMHEQFLTHHRHGEWFNLLQIDLERFLELMAPIGKQVK